MSKDPVIAYFGHHKCASQFINSIFRDIAELLGLVVRLEALPLELPLGYHLKNPHRTRIEEMRTRISAHDYDILLHGNADQRLLEQLNERGYRGFHMIRDPRDIVISGYFSHKASHPANLDTNPWLVEHRDRLQHADQEEGILIEIDYCETYFERMNKWDYNNIYIYETKFEVLRTQPEAELRKVLEHLGFSVPSTDLRILRALGQRVNKAQRHYLGRPLKRWLQCPELCLSSIVTKNSFERKAGGRQMGQEDSSSHYRKGTSGDWKNYFTPKIKEKFKQKYPQLLINLKYEKDDSW